MKQLKITVNGTTYDVCVEEVGEVASAPVAAPVQAAPVAAPAPAAAPAAAGGETVCAPMPGTILSVVVSAGQAIKKGDVLCVLEAMKMENEIYAPRDGEVASVSVTKGEAVESGKVLVTLK